MIICDIEEGQQQGYIPRSLHYNQGHSEGIYLQSSMWIECHMHKNRGLVTLLETTLDAMKEIGLIPELTDELIAACKRKKISVIQAIDCDNEGATVQRKIDTVEEKFRDVLWELITDLKSEVRSGLPDINEEAFETLKEEI